MASSGELIFDPILSDQLRPSCWLGSRSATKYGLPSFWSSALYLSCHQQLEPIQNVTGPYFNKKAFWWFSDNNLIAFILFIDNLHRHTSSHSWASSNLRCKISQRYQRGKRKRKSELSSSGAFPLIWDTPWRNSKNTIKHHLIKTKNSKQLTPYKNPD